MKSRLIALLVFASQASLADEPAHFESVVRSQRAAPEPATTSVTSDGARTAAGTQGDPLKVVEDLPGVARAAFGSGQLTVWGSSPNDTRVYIDEVEVPALYHLGGLRSVVNGDLVSNIALTPGGYGAAYGRGLGGLLQIETRPLDGEGVHGYAGADLLDASAMITAAIGKRLHVAVAGRYSYVDRILGGIVAPKIGDYVPIPRYDDYQLKATLDLRTDEELTLLFLAADDHLHRAIASDDPVATRSEDTDTSSYRLMLRYARALPDDTQIKVTPFFGYDTNHETHLYGATPTRLDVDSYRYGLRASYRHRVARVFTLSVGLDLLGTKSQIVHVGSLTVPAREGDIYVFGQAPGDDVATDRYSTHILEAAPYVIGELRFGRFTITPGIRASMTLIEGDHSLPQLGTTPVQGYSRIEWAADPRLALSWHVHRRVTLLASAGTYHQAPAPEDLSAVFGNPTLGLQRAAQVTAGAKLLLHEGLDAEVIGFWKQLDELVTRSALDSPPVARALVQDGTGHAYGGQLLLRGAPWHGLSGWVSYSLSRSERQDHPGAQVRLFDYDQTHALAVVASYAYRSWSFGARFRYSSGYPRTPVIGAYFDARSDESQPRFGAQNSIRIPDFWQLDLRVDKTITWRRVALNLYLDVQNVTYRQNPEEIVYSADYAQRGYITGLPTLAVLGARALF